MRSPQAMKALVQREAKRRRSQRRLLAATSAGAVALLLVGVAVARPGSEDPTVLSTASETAPSTAWLSTDAGTVPASSALTTTTATTPDGERDTAEEQGSSPAGGASGATSTTRASAPPGGSDEPAGPDPSSPSPTWPSSTSPPAPTVPETTSTTDPSSRTCAAGDFITPEVRLSVPGTGDQYPENTAPANRRSEFGYSFGLRAGIAPCWIHDPRIVLTITSTEDVFAFRSTFDDARAPRQVQPGDWVRFRAVIAWDPSCADLELPGWIQVLCDPAPPGTYRVEVYDQGATFAPITVTVVPGA
jgi:hypothetical protein